MVARDLQTAICRFRIVCSLLWRYSDVPLCNRNCVRVKPPYGGGSGVLVYSLAPSLLRKPHFSKSHQTPIAFEPQPEEVIKILVFLSLGLQTCIKNLVFLKVQTRNCVRGRSFQITKRSTSIGVSNSSKLECCTRSSGSSGSGTERAVRNHPDSLLEPR